MEGDALMFWDFIDEPKSFVFRTSTLTSQKLYVKSYFDGVKKYDSSGNRLPFKYVHKATRYFLYKDGAMIGFIIEDLNRRTTVSNFLAEAKYKLRCFLLESL